MSRTPVAALLGLSGFVLYVALVVTLADHVLQMHWAVQGLYFAIAGVAWTWPARALIIWAAQGGRQG